MENILDLRDRLIVVMRKSFVQKTLQINRLRALIARSLWEIVPTREIHDGDFLNRELLDKA